MLLMRPVHVVDARCLRQRLGCRRRRRSVRACERACYYLPFALLSVSRVRGVVVWLGKLIVDWPEAASQSRRAGHCLLLEVNPPWSVQTGGLAALRRGDGVGDRTSPCDDWAESSMLIRSSTAESRTMRDSVTSSVWQLLHMCAWMTVYQQSEHPETASY